MEIPMNQSVESPPQRSAPDKRLAERDTPLIHECWYVAAWSEEVGRKPLDRRILGYPVVLYRTSKTVVALHNRCAHRSMPLSLGFLQGDDLVCAYHGLIYDPSGLCIRVPADPKPPKNLRVKSYPVIERGPLLWIWMGDPANADPALIPEVPWLSDPGWDFTSGYTPVKSSYIRLHENLLDTTHFTYLHPGNVGTPEYATAPSYDTDPTPGFAEVSVGSDSPGVQMRRILQRKAMEEEKMRASKLAG
jgi:phenylpropionate dioxygenase-like ring-hydroxylating dioxygenase large terminal subunit